MRSPLLVTVAALGLATSALAQPARDRFAGVRATIQRFLDSTGTSSVAVAAARDDGIVWEEGFGWADRERRIRADQHTMYSLASISKPITATGLMVLFDRGLVDLDRPANDYLGAGKLTGLAGDAAGATLRRIMSHTAGLPLHYQFFYQDRGYSPPTMDETIARYGNLVFPPGRLHEYSNLGFGIVDHIIGRIAGQPYADFMRTEVFLPLGLTRTSIDIGPGLEDFVAQRYDADQKPIPFYRFDHTGASAVYSSAHDLVRFGMFHAKARLAEQRPILKPATIDLMHQPVPPASYGLGFRIAPDDMGLYRIGHGGGMPGVATVLNIFPAEKIVVVVLTNGGPRPEAIAQEIAAAMIPRYADTLAARRARPPAATERPWAAPAELIGDWRGTLRTWSKTVPLRLEIRADGDAFVWLADQPRAVVNQLTFQNGRLTGRFAGAIPTADAGRWPHSIQLGLELIDGDLRGQVSAQAAQYYSLASFAELRRTR